LSHIAEDISSPGTTLEDQAKLQFDKMIRNANFQGAFDRAHRESKKESKTPLSIGLQIAEAISKQGESSGASEKVRFLMPLFLQKLPIEAELETKTKQGAHLDALNLALVSPKDFIELHTDHGTLYHATSALAGLCVLRGGFILSSQKQGTAAYGPGTYAAKTREEASEYLPPQGIMLPLHVAKQKNMRILDWTKVPEEVQAQIKQESLEKGFEHEFDLLRSREHYAVDIILNGPYVLLQNQSAIEIKESLEAMLDWLQTPILQAKSKIKGCINKESKIDYDQFLEALTNFLDGIPSYHHFHELLKSMGADVTHKPTAIKLLFNLYETTPHNNVLKLSILLLSQAENLLENKDDPMSIAMKEALNKLTLEADVNETRQALVLSQKLFSTDSFFASITALSSLQPALLSEEKPSIELMFLAIILNRADIITAILKTNPEIATLVIPNGQLKGYHPLTLAILDNKTKIAKAILSANPETASHIITAGDNEGHNALTLAIAHDNTELAKAIFSANPETASYIIIDGNDKGHNALTLAIEYDNTELAKAILLANPNAASRVMTEDYYKGHNALTLAIQHDNTELAKAVLSANPETASHVHVITDGDNKGHNALTLALKMENVELAKAIFEANPKATSHIITDGDNKGHNAFTLALQRGNVTLLAKAIFEANPKAALAPIEKYENTAFNALISAIECDAELAMAILKANPKAASLVITYRYDIRKGHNALILALKRWNTKLAKALLEANPETALHVITDGDNKGHNALTIAILLKNIDMTSAIIKANPKAASHVITDGPYKGLNALALAQKLGETTLLETIQAMITTQKEKTPAPPKKKSLRFSEEKAEPRKEGALKAMVTTQKEKTPREEEKTKSPQKPPTGKSKK
ncbi:MAG TPA: ankyrin repeat domain-containing protein, partial [Gammaproteobacteria bacterium]|nr:ankyrin repeat domain-containing protein [Gammaproteobacteria bacterium]